MSDNIKYDPQQLKAFLEGKSKLLEQAKKAGGTRDFDNEWSVAFLQEKKSDIRFYFDPEGEVALLTGCHSIWSETEDPDSGEKTRKPFKTVCVNHLRAMYPPEELVGVPETCQICEISALLNDWSLGIGKQLKAIAFGSVLSTENETKYWKPGVHALISGNSRMYEALIDILRNNCVENAEIVFPMMTASMTGRYINVELVKGTQGKVTMAIALKGDIPPVPATLLENMKPLREMAEDINHIIPFIYDEEMYTNALTAVRKTYGKKISEAMKARALANKAAAHPLAAQPADQQPPAQPPVQQPAATQPVEQPPAATQPVEQPPAATQPVEQPPAQQPPAEQPAAQPPAQQPAATTKEMRPCSQFHLDDNGKPTMEDQPDEFFTFTNPECLECMNNLPCIDK